MSMDDDNRTFTDGSSSGSSSLTDAPLMASTPIWEQRGKKKKGFGRGVAATTAATASTAAHTPVETRTFDTSGPASRMEAPLTSTGTTADVHDTYGLGASTAEQAAVDPDGEAGLAAPIGRTRTTTTHRRSGAAPAAIAVGVLALAGIGAAGWYASHDRDDGVPELTPGQTTTALAPPADTTAIASATAPAPAARQTVTVSSDSPRATVRTARAAPRVRPAAPAATASGINASARATLPGTPQPYSTVNPSAAPSATSPSDTSATAPSTVNPTPAPIPATPPVQTPDTPPAESPPQDTATPTPPQ
jgi:hypothetical protein